EEVTETKENHVAVKLKVREGAATHIDRIDVRGLESLSESQRNKVIGALPLEQGKVFREDQWAQAQAKLTEVLQQLGYAGVTLDAEAAVDLDTQKANLTLDATMGQRYRFGRTVVNNPDRHVPNEKVVEEVESAATPGEWFTPEALAEAQKRVFQ